jgi:hypothetical protein
MKNSTALEYFIEELFKQIDYIQVDTKLIQQAKEMEKGQIVDAIDYCREKYIDSENYYNETFKSE